MTRRYFVPELPKAGGLVTLLGGEAQHASRVMRVQVGETVTLFDGAGHESQARFISVGRNECQCETEPRCFVDREPTNEIHLSIALPKLDRSRELIERLTEIGVKSVTPLVASRTQRPPSDSFIQKLNRGVVEACKQCGRNQLLEIRPTVKASLFFQNCSVENRWIAHPSTSAMSVHGEVTGPVVVAIGPEGGWAEDEYREAVNHGFTPMDLGRRIYRIETAATVVASILAS